MEMQLGRGWDYGGGAGMTLGSWRRSWEPPRILEEEMGSGWGYEEGSEARLGL